MILDEIKQVFSLMSKGWEVMEKSRFLTSLMKIKQIEVEVKVAVAVDLEEEEVEEREDNISMKLLSSVSNVTS